MKSIKWKLMAMYLGLVFIVMIVSGSYILLSFNNSEMKKAESQLMIYAEKISDQVVLSYDEVSFQTGLYQFTRSGESSDQIQGSILNSEGETIVSTVTNKPPYPQYKYSAIISAMAGSPAFSKIETRENGENKRYFCYAYPVVEVNGVAEYIIFAQMDAEATYDSISQTQNAIVLAVIMALFMAAVMGYVFAKTITDPIQTLTLKAKDLAEGRLNQSVKVYSADEIGQLSESFNYMAKELSSTVGEISREKNKFETTLRSMTDGVISFDKDGNVVHYNSACMEMLDIDEVKFTFQEFIDKFDIGTGILIDLIEKSSKVVNFYVGKKYITAGFSAYGSKGDEMEGTVVVLQDNTEQKHLDDMRKEFVANVSHELRTPLTTVKSYTETLLDGAIDDRETAVEFLDIINSEADRMSFLVRDLLQLSRFDNKQFNFSFSKINVNGFIAENIRQSKIHAENKRQKLTFTPFERGITITADKDRITQVFNNILTNAIKYSPEEASIDVSVSESINYFKIAVKDTGIGIPKEDLGRVFDRFYRVDKARSRAMGGTGLGLAIAKEIMEAHGGKITVESEYGKGTTMTMWFLKVISIKEGVL